MSTNIENQPYKLRSFKISDPSENKKNFYDNSIITAKYNFLTFLPLALIYQFKSQFNVFQLVTAIILCIREVSPYTEFGSSVGPVAAIIAIGMIREAIEDVKKTQYDIEYNNSLTLAYDSEMKRFNEKKWKDLLVGDIIKVNKNEIIPADVVIIYSTNETGISFLQTTNLDGESTLKPREALRCFKDYTVVEELIDNIGGTVEVDQPNNNFYRAEGTVIAGEKKINFDVNQILLRGGTLRNVNYIYGIIIYTGLDTKLMQNIQPSTPKLSYIEIQLNKMIYYIILIMMIFSGVSTGIGVSYQAADDIQADGLEAAWYVYPKLSTSTTQTTLAKYVQEVFQIFCAFFINYTTFLPLSLMVLIEIIKPIQLVNLSLDESMKTGDEEFKAFSMKLQENLGAVKYVFSDKTGTLTKNEMIFHSCSIFGKLFEADSSLHLQLDTNKPSDSDNPPDKFNGDVEPIQENDVPKSKTLFQNIQVKEQLFEGLKCTSQTHIEDPDNPFDTIASTVNEFLIGISLNHNILPEANPETGEIFYTGSSPDEVALITTIRELGVEFIQKSGNTLTIKVNGVIIVYELLFQFDFSSERKRSSIIVKDPNGNIKLYMKGADDIILDKINDFSKVQLKSETKMHLDKFAKYGLRTLCYTVKPLTAEYFEHWVKEYDEMKYKSISDKSLIKEVGNLVNKIEDKSFLLGVTGLEDKLQDEVKDVINELLNASISVWMLTGDKLDTAESIGFSCKLFNDDTEVFKIHSSGKEQVLSEMKKTLYEMTKLEEELMNFKIQKTKGDIVREAFQGEKKKIDNLRRASKDIYDKDLQQGVEKAKEIEMEILGNQNLYNKEGGKTLNPEENVIGINLNKIIFLEKEIKINNLVHTPNLDHLNDDIAILQFIMQQKKEEQYRNEKEESVTIINHIINEEYNRQNNHEADGIADANGVNHVLFEINNVYDNYQSKILVIDEKKKGLLNKMEVIDAKEKLERERKEKSALLINFGLIIEGEAISHFVDPELAEYSWQLVQKCRSIICCRCNPLQKSEVVRYVKDHTTDIVLSIGDGGNDVNMIKEAHVGIGIFGKEGMQAAYNSDYAISQFKYLKRLLFYHGRHYLLRNSYFILFYLWKNLIFTIPQFWISFFSQFSGSNIYEYWHYLGYNSIFTVVPHGMRMIYNEDLDTELEGYPESVKKLIPELYKESRDSQPFNIQKYFITTFVGFLQSMIIYFFPYIAHAYIFNVENQDGRPQGYWDVSESVFVSVLMVQFVILIEDSNIWNKNIFIGWAWQFGSMAMILIAMNYLSFIEISYIIFNIFDSLNFWLNHILVVVVSVIAVTIYQRLNILFYDTITNNIRLEKFELDQSKIKLIKKIEKMSEISRNVAKFKKILNEKNFIVDNYADKRVKVWVDKYRSAGWEKEEQLRRRSSLRNSLPKHPPSTELKGDNNGVQGNNGDNKVDYNHIGTEVIKMNNDYEGI